MNDVARATIRRLWLPIYVPTLLFAAGTAALTPVLPLLALELGFGAAGAATLLAAAGAFAVVAPVPAGFLVGLVGERFALLAGGAVCVVADALCWAAAAGVVPGGPWVFGTAVLAIAAGAVVWDLGRQGFLADQVPAEVRARAMTLFGGTQRIGRVLGPMAGAGVLALWGTAAAIAVDMVCCLLAMGLVARFVPKGQRDVPRPAEASAAPSDPAGVRTVLLGAAGVMTLEAARAARGVFLVLCATRLGLEAGVISLLFGVTAAIEIGLFPLGAVMMERYGRVAALVPAQLAFAVGFIALPLAPSFAWLMAAVALMAAGNGVSAGINKTLGADLTPSRNRARYLGLWNSVVGVGTVTGPGAVALVVAASGLPSAGVALAGLLVAGATWSSWWIPRLVPPLR